MKKYLFHNGTILTQNPSQPTAEAILTDGYKILAVGRVEEVQKKVDANTQPIDLQGKTLMPGFVDAHIHLWKVGNLLTYTLDLRGSKSIIEIKEKIKNFAAQYPDNQYINARGFNESNLVEKRMLNRTDLDDLGIEKPIIVQRTCAHITVVNTFTLEKIKEKGLSFEVEGGKTDIENGVLYETAQGLVQKITPHYNADDYKTMVKAATDALREVGVTTVCDPAVMPDLLEVYHSLSAENQLDIRINAVPIRLPDGGENPLPLPQQWSSETLVVNTVKFFADGGLSGKTAALLRTYKDSDEKGILRLSPFIFYQLAAEAQAEGLMIATHAIGDDAIELVIDTYEKLFAKYQISNRIEHLGLPHESHLIRIRKANSFIVSQPVFLDELGKNFIQYIDNEYLSICYPYKSILQKGIKLAFSTDAPVVKNLNPFQSIQSAVTRKTNDNQTIAKEESITIAEGLFAYTNMAAQALRMHDRVGSIEIGKLADLIIIDKNPLETNVEDLTKIKIEQIFFAKK